MFCKSCGQQMPDGQDICPHCGAAQNTAPAPQQYAPPPYPPYVQPPQQQIIVNAGNAPSNGMATAGFVLAILGVFLGFTFIIQTLALIFSIVGIVKANSLNGKGRGLAIAGLIISLLAFVPGILLIMLFAGVLGAAASYAGASVALTALVLL